VHTLPPFWQAVSRINPFFYAVDGFRYGFFGQSDVDPPRASRLRPPPSLSYH
jgi:ABC-2 type transport system permease protein